MLNGQAERVRIEVAKELQDYLEEYKKTLAIQVKKLFNLDSVTVNGTFTSQVLAKALTGDKKINFKIRKTGLNKGIIEID